MRVVSLHPDVLVATSAIWQTNCVIVRGPLGVGGGSSEKAGGSGAWAGGSGAWEGGSGEPMGETFVIDSPVLPEELEALPAVVEQAGFPAPSGLLATHGDWDHLLGRLAFGDLALGCAESTAARMGSRPGEAQRELRTFDEEHFVERAGPLALGAVQALPVPGRCGIGEGELELHPATGHTSDGMAVLIGWADVLVAGDYLSPVELPVLGSGGETEAYAQTLERLRPLVERVSHIVPGHGRVLDREQALEILDADLADARGGEGGGDGGGGDGGGGDGGGGDGGGGDGAGDGESGERGGGGARREGAGARGGGPSSATRLRRSSRWGRPPR